MMRWKLKEVLQVIKTHRIAFRCDEDTFNMIKENAEDKSLTMTDYLTFLALNDSEPIEGEEMDMKGGE